MERLGRALACTALLCLPGCNIFRRNQVSPPVIAAPPTKPSKPIENPQVPPPPKVEQAVAPVAPPLVVSEIPAKPPPPAVVPKPPKQRTRRVAAKATQPTPAPIQTAAAAAPPSSVPPSASPSAAPETEAQGPAPDQPTMPVLTPVLSSGQQVAFNRAIDIAIDQAQSGLAEVSAKSMSQTQRANADRALSFIEQAQQLRASDLVTAKSLADRAVVLTRALVAETR